MQTPGNLQDQVARVRTKCTQVWMRRQAEELTMPHKPQGFHRFHIQNADTSSEFIPHQRACMTNGMHGIEPPSLPSPTHMSQVIRWEYSMLRNKTCNPFIRNTACLGTRESNRAAETKHRRGTRTAHRPSGMHHPCEGKTCTVQRKYVHPAQNTNRCPENTSKVPTVQRKCIQ